MIANGTVQIMPSEEVIQAWVASLVSPMDLFIADERLVTQLGAQASVLIIPRAEFDAHPTYRDVRIANAYTYWTIDRDAPYVLHAPPHWIETLTPEVRRDVLTHQVKVGRGLVFQATADLLGDQLSTSRVTWDGQSYLVLHRSTYEAMSDSGRQQLTLAYAKEWDEWTARTIPEDCPNHIKRWANTFPAISGSNCLAATLFAVMKEDWITSQWVHPGTFLQTLGQAGYVQVETEMVDPGDVLTFVDEAGRIPHATYCLGNSLFFNKNGQTMFNPWKLIHEDDLFASWGSYGCNSYRRQQ